MTHPPIDPLNPPALQSLNTAPMPEVLAALGGLYEHSAWIVERAFARRPFASIAALRQACIAVLRDAGRDAQLALIRAHPELAGRAMVAGTLTAHSTQEQQRSGLTQCTPEEFATLTQLNDAYNARFGWPFILAVGGPRGRGLTRAEVIATFQRRLRARPEHEFAESLRQIHRIAEMRLNAALAVAPVRGQRLWDEAEALAAHSDPGFAEAGQLATLYATPAHQAVAAQMAAWMREAGFDTVHIDAVGNVVGIYHGTDPQARRLLTGSHYDTVRNAGRHDGRLGVTVPLAAVRALAAQGRRLPFGIEVVAFSEEEGQRYKATFLASSALAGCFDPDWLDQQDADGVTLREAMRAAGWPGTMDAIAALKRDPSRYLGFVEVHIEQGPVLHDADLPLGVVTAINGSVRYLGELRGQASHAGTTPMDRRRDAAAGVAELVLAVERLAAASPGTVGTVGQLEVPAGSINIVPGRCRFSLDLRATTDAARDALDAAVQAELARIAEARALDLTLERTMTAAAAPSAPAWQARWEAALQALGLPVHRLPSGAGHDAMKLHEVMPQAMLFVRGGNGGISHNPLESITADDAELAIAAFEHLLHSLAKDTA